MTKMPKMRKHHKKKSKKLGFQSNPATSNGLLKQDTGSSDSSELAKVFEESDVILKVVDPLGTQCCDMQKMVLRLLDHEAAQKERNVQLTDASCATNVIVPEVSSEVMSSERLTTVKRILSRGMSDSSPQFLTGHNKSNLLTLETLKQPVEMKDGVRHSANPIMLTGTTDWLSRVTDWETFSATTGQSGIHRGNLQQGWAAAGKSAYMGHVWDSFIGQCIVCSGSLGLIHADHGEGIKQFLCYSLHSTNVEVIQHGARLGLGMSAFETADEENNDAIKSMLYTDSAGAGEAVGINMGLLMVETASENTCEILAHTHETQHDKIIRGLALENTLMVYGTDDKADTLNEQITRDQNLIPRHGGVYALALAYSRTTNNNSIHQLLGFAASDVSEEVKRNAALALGFVLYSVPEQTPDIVRGLTQSYNPHVRYGAALAVGISCAGTGLSEAMSLLEPLSSDYVDFVRQGALIAMAMVMVRPSEASDSHVSTFRRKLENRLLDKHKDIMSQMGAICTEQIYPIVSELDKVRKFWKFWKIKNGTVILVIVGRKGIYGVADGRITSNAPENNGQIMGSRGRKVHVICGRLLATISGVRGSDGEELVDHVIKTAKNRYHMFYIKRIINQYLAEKRERDEDFNAQVDVYGYLDGFAMKYSTATRSCRRLYVGAVEGCGSGYTFAFLYAQSFVHMHGELRGLTTEDYFTVLDEAAAFGCFHDPDSGGYNMLFKISRKRILNEHVQLSPGHHTLAVLQNRYNEWLPSLGEWYIVASYGVVYSFGAEEMISGLLQERFQTEVLLNILTISLTHRLIIRVMRFDDNHPYNGDIPTYEELFVDGDRTVAFMTPNADCITDLADLSIALPSSRSLRKML